MGSYGELGKVIIYALGAIILIAIVGYAGYAWSNSGIEQERKEYRTEIGKAVIEKEALQAKETERKAAEAFDKIEEQINAASTETRNNTREKIKDENITDFIDTF